jgi:1,4-dihydroxy-2-naphthoate octaprenyltransferase
MASAIRNWGEIIRTQNLSPDKEMDPVSALAADHARERVPDDDPLGLIGGLLAARAPGADGFLFSLALVGLVAAHAANNMINDYFDLEGGVDSQDYVRAQYAPHPVLSGLISKKGLCSRSRS